MGMKTTRKQPFKRRGPDALLLHLLQAGGSVAAQFSSVTAQQKFARMLDGIKKYQEIAIAPIHRKYDVVWEKGAMRVMRLPGGRRAGVAPPVILIPSLINGPEILDLMPGHSFACYLQQNGFDVYIIDWGDVLSDKTICRMDDLLHKCLAVAVADVAKKSGQNVILAGYCMGGLLMAGAYPRLRDHVRGMAYLATPWDFHAGDPRLTQMVRQAAPHMLPMLAATPHLPNFQIQSLFALVDPAMAINKYSRFADMKIRDAAVKTFVAVEDWLQTGRDLPRDIARVCFEDWYLHNLTARGQWRVGGDLITPTLLKSCKSLVVAPRRDQLVETQTAKALATQLGRAAKYLEPDCGHIGMMVSPRAQADVWSPIIKWLKTLS